MSKPPFNLQSVGACLLVERVPLQYRDLPSIKAECRSLVARFHSEDGREWPASVHDLDVDAYCSAIIEFVRGQGYLINDEPWPTYGKVPSADFGRWEPSQ